MIRLWRIDWFERTPPIEQVDFGNGQQISAVDLLDGHFHQLTAQSDQRERQAKLAVVAPTLTPLTDLAEAVAETVPEIHPTSDFRNTLNKALTETHRQHHAQRVLGIRSVEPDTSYWRNLLLISVLMAIITVGVAFHGQHLARSRAT